MHSPESQEVVMRFFRALQFLIDDGQIKSRNRYCKKHGFVQGHLWLTEKERFGTGGEKGGVGCDVVPAEINWKTRSKSDPFRPRSGIQRYTFLLSQL